MYNNLSLVSRESAGEEEEEQGDGAYEGQADQSWNQIMIKDDRWHYQGKYS